MNDVTDLREKLILTGEKSLSVALDENRSVTGFPGQDGIGFVFTSHGIQTKIALSYEALEAAYLIGQRLQGKAYKMVINQIIEYALDRP